MDQVTRPARRVVLCTVVSDAHTWNLVFLQLMLEEAGYEVTNLGPCTPVGLVLGTLRAGGADALVVSSVNGHAHRDGADLIRAVRADGWTGLPAVIGGKLGITVDVTGELAGGLVDAGFDMAYSDGADPGELSAYLARRTALRATAEPRP